MSINDSPPLLYGNPPERSSLLTQSRPRFTLDRTIKFGEILTMVTIIVSVIALLTTLSKDRRLRISEHATKVRDAAAQTLAKLDRLEELSTSVFDEVQPLIVDVSEKSTLR